MKNKKTTMAVSAFFILIFHLWIYVTTSKIEPYLRQMCVIGVDLFFFVSSYSISKIKEGEYISFIKNRFMKIYTKFFFFSLVGFFFLSWTIPKLIKTLLGIELLIKGGGSFLWFLPGIMIIYLLLPLYQKLDSKYPKMCPLFTTICYITLSIIISTKTNYHAIFILWNRIPIILLGYYFGKYHILERLQKDKLTYWAFTIPTLLLGFFITYFVYQNHIQLIWWKDAFYLFYLPLIIGMELLLDQVKGNWFINFVSSITLELYGLQMIIGFRLANTILKCTNLKLITNLLTIFILLLVAGFIHYIFELLNHKKEAKNV